MTSRSFTYIYMQQDLHARSSFYKFQNYDFGVYVQVWAISLKLDISSSNLEVLMHICDTYNRNYLPHTIFLFYLTDFQLNTDSPSILLPWNNQKLSKDGYFKKVLLKIAKHKFPIFYKAKGSIYSFTLIDNFRFLR